MGLTMALCFQTGDPRCASPSELSQLVESLPELCTELRLPFSTLLLRPLWRCSIDLELIEEVRLGTSGGTFLPLDPRDRPPDPSWHELLQFCVKGVCTLYDSGDMQAVLCESREYPSCLIPHRASCKSHKQKQHLERTISVERKKKH